MAYWIGGWGKQMLGIWEKKPDDKIGRDWIAPVTPEVRKCLIRLHKESAAVGDTVLFPVPSDPERPITRHAATSWLRQAEKLAGVKHQLGGAWHAFRRSWASQRKHLSIKDVCAVGGWLDSSTLLRCYQHADQETMERVVLGGRKLSMVR